MAEYGGDRGLLTFKAGADLTAKRYHIMRLTATEKVINQASHAAAGFALGIVGVLDNAPNTNQHASVVYRGPSKVVAGGSVAVNVLITTNGSGRATAAVSGDLVVGRALSAAAADGDVINALIYPTVRLSGAV